MAGKSSIFKDIFDGIGKALKNPVTAFTAGNLSSDIFKLGIYKPAQGVEAQAPQPLSSANVTPPKLPSWMMYAVGGVLLLLVLKR